MAWAIIGMLTLLVIAVFGKADYFDCWSMVRTRRNARLIIFWKDLRNEHRSNIKPGHRANPHWPRVGKGGRWERGSANQRQRGLQSLQLQAWIETALPIRGKWWMGDSVMLTKITYDEYHVIYADHLMRDVDIPPAFRIVEVEYYNHRTEWYKTELPSFNLIELTKLNKAIRQVLIS